MKNNLVDIAKETPVSGEQPKRTHYIDTCIHQGCNKIGVRDRDLGGPYCDEHYEVAYREAFLFPQN
jgi:hypothetical protein